MENRYFQEAVASMAAGFAYVDAVKHLYKQGYSVKEIQKNLTYPVSLEKIEKVIAEYEEKMKKTDSEFEYVQVTNEFGKKSFIRVSKEKG
ncbi:MAG: hypothetical protein Q4D51_02940 [Eubacteriales bacterium]|nr:hypothetical protein [Eubacteriales bacterium]